MTMTRRPESRGHHQLDSHYTRKLDYIPHIMLHLALLLVSAPRQAPLEIDNLRIFSSVMMTLLVLAYHHAAQKSEMSKRGINGIGHYILGR